VTYDTASGMGLLASATLPWRTSPAQNQSRMTVPRAGKKMLAEKPAPAEEREPPRGSTGLPDPEEVEEHILASRREWEQRFGVAATSEVRVVERIVDHLLVREAEAARHSLPGEIEQLLNKLNHGNELAGRGRRHICGPIFEARGYQGARVYYRHAGLTVEVVALSTKANQDQVCERLRLLYDT
jgi:plasmid stabilization system protein ParE